MSKPKVSRSSRGKAGAAAASPVPDVIPMEGDQVFHGINNRLEYAGQKMTPEGALRAVAVTTSGPDVGTLGGSASAARDINDAGAVVGGSLTKGDQAFHAFLYEDGHGHHLNDLIAPDGHWQLIQRRHQRPRARRTSSPSVIETVSMRRVAQSAAFRVPVCNVARLTG